MAVSVAIKSMSDYKLQKMKGKDSATHLINKTYLFSLGGLILILVAVIFLRFIPLFKGVNGKSYLYSR